MPSESWPRSRGTYALLLRLGQTTETAIGRLGPVVFPAGYYLYAGSAFGSGGLKARLGRHQRRDKRIFWHIDYLLKHARIVGICADVSGQRLECAWALSFLKMPGARVVAPRFGASDCHCPSHLVYVAQGAGSACGALRAAIRS